MYISLQNSSSSREGNACPKRARQSVRCQEGKRDASPRESPPVSTIMLPCETFVSHACKITHSFGPEKSSPSGTRSGERGCGWKRGRRGWRKMHARSHDAPLLVVSLVLARTHIIIHHHAAHLRTPSAYTRTYTTSDTHPLRHRRPPLRARARSPPPACRAAVCRPDKEASK